MDNDEIKKFIKKHSPLFWYIPENRKEGISLEVLVEFVLNNGDLNTVKELFNLLGIEKVAEIFYKTINISPRRRGNYHELTLNYFDLVFKRYTQRNLNKTTN